MHETILKEVKKSQYYLRMLLGFTNLYCIVLLFNFSLRIKISFMSTLLSAILSSMTSLRIRIKLMRLFGLYQVFSLKELD